MTMTLPIVVDSVSKCYQIYEHPKDRFKQAMLNRLRHSGIKSETSGNYYREYWALRDISFELAPGETVGVLGRNGAGKSTLLQIIVGTLAPTAGRVITNGRITALLELGSGFNPEFTGRENVLLNAQILGLTETQAEERFDEIASFADIGSFIDQPVKTYSSGMMVRLAFAVQTAVDPKILVVDEALAVGDMFFQAKCISRIKKLVDQGVALLFVSHDVGAVRQLCSRALLLQGGRLEAFGDAKLVSDRYASQQLRERNEAARATLDARGVLEEKQSASNQELSPGSTPLESEDVQGWREGIESFMVRASHNRTGNHDAEILNVQMLSYGKLSGEFEFDEEAEIHVYVKFHRRMDNVNLSLQIRNRQGTGLVFFDLRIQEEMKRSYEEGVVYRFDWRIKLPLMTEHYTLMCALAHPPIVPGEDWVFIDVVPDACEFHVMPMHNRPVSSYVVLPARVDIRSMLGVN